MTRVHKIGIPTLPVTAGTNPVTTVIKKNITKKGAVKTEVNHLHTGRQENILSLPDTPKSDMESTNQDLPRQDTILRTEATTPPIHRFHHQKAPPTGLIPIPALQDTGILQNQTPVDGKVIVLKENPLGEAKERTYPISLETGNRPSKTISEKSLPGKA